MRRTLVALLAAASLSAPMAALPAETLAARQQQDGLVNVAVGDITLRNISVGVAANVVANACDLLDVGDVAILARQVDRTGNTATTDCDATGDNALRITQN